MAELVKHVGVIENTGSRCVVVFKEVPGDEDNCLIVNSDALPDVYHEGVMRLVESDEGQQSLDLGDLMSRRLFADGQNMLETLHVKRLLQKVPSGKVLLTPNKQTSIRLSEINKIIREQKGNKPQTTEIVDDPKISQNTAKAMLDRADMLERQIADLHSEAERLREDAYALDSSLRPVKRGRPKKQSELSVD